MKRQRRLLHKRNWGIGPCRSAERLNEYTSVELPEGYRAQVSKNISSLGLALAGGNLSKVSGAESPHKGRGFA